MSSVVSYLQSTQTEQSQIPGWKITCFILIHKWWISNVLLSDCFFPFCKVFVLVSNNKIGNYKYHFWHNLDQFDRISWQNTVIFKYHLSDCFWKYHDRIVVKTREKYTAFFHYSSCFTGPRQFTQLEVWYFVLYIGEKWAFSGHYLFSSSSFFPCW